MVRQSVYRFEGLPLYHIALSGDRKRELESSRLDCGDSMTQFQEIEGRFYCFIGKSQLT